MVYSLEFGLRMIVLWLYVDPWKMFICVFSQFPYLNLVSLQHGAATSFVDFDSPHELLAISSGHFSHLDIEMTLWKNRMMVGSTMLLIISRILTFAHMCFPRMVRIGECPCWGTKMMDDRPRAAMDHAIRVQEACLGDHPGTARHPR